MSKKEPLPRNVGKYPIEQGRPLTASEFASKLATMVARGMSVDDAAYAIIKKQFTHAGWTVKNGTFVRTCDSCRGKGCLTCRYTGKQRITPTQIRAFITAALFGYTKGTRNR